MRLSKKKKNAAILWCRQNNSTYPSPNINQQKLICGTLKPATELFSCKMMPFDQDDFLITDRRIGRFKQNHLGSFSIATENFNLLFSNAPNILCSVSDVSIITTESNIV